LKYFFNIYKKLSKACHIGKIKTYELSWSFLLLVKDICCFPNNWDITSLLKILKWWVHESSLILVKMCCTFCFREVDITLWIKKFFAFFSFLAFKILLHIFFIHYLNILMNLLLLIITNNLYYKQMWPFS
jgi:hypothetical protein